MVSNFDGCWGGVLNGALSDFDGGTLCRVGTWRGEGAHVCACLLLVACGTLHLLPLGLYSWYVAGYFTGYALCPLPGLMVRGADRVCTRGMLRRWWSTVGGDPSPTSARCDESIQCGAVYQLHPGPRMWHGLNGAYSLQPRHLFRHAWERHMHASSRGLLPVSLGSNQVFHL